MYYTFENFINYCDRNNISLESDLSDKDLDDDFDDLNDDDEESSENIITTRNNQGEVTEYPDDKDFINKTNTKGASKRYEEDKWDID